MPRPLVVAAFVSFILGLVKLSVALWTGSQALRASAVDSLSDAVISTSNALLARWAAEPADAGHPYGHGKAESLGGLLQVLALGGGILWIVVSAVLRLLEPETPAPVALPAILTLVGSLGVSFVLGRHLAAEARAKGSLAMAADAIHYRMDAASGVAALIGVGVAAWTGSGVADSVGSLVVAALMSRDLWGLGRTALDQLLDSPLPPEEIAKVEAILRDEPEVRGWHDLRTRRAGPTRFVDVHLELDGELTLAEAHRIADRVEERIFTEVERAVALVHVDPVGAEEERRGNAG